MTLIYELDLDIPKMYLHAKVKFLAQGFKKLEPDRQDRQTDRRDRMHYHAVFAGGIKHNNRLS